MILTAILTIFLIKDGIAYKDCDGHDRFPDYYWREYKGEIPADAIPGGRDTKGKTTYIGHFHIPNQGIHPAVIYPDTKTLSVSASQLTRKPGKDTKILCSRAQHMFKWIPTNLSTIHLLTGYHFVVGGFHPNQMMYIGRRKMDNGELLVAKVLEYSEGAKGIHVNINKQLSKALPDFELLVYDYQAC
ncbi:uncharacterized protein LOC116164287 [Photinus pyralis]|uniref:uncharacterized protein LOC116164287 n=1 Tax=Photinus pyralis TaxID=7054 RepID=UPI0012672137|nr:uncharacterized protein LOC116164287 [Photinus pyralis]